MSMVSRGLNAIFAVIEWLRMPHHRGVNDGHVQCYQLNKSDAERLVS